MDFLRDTLTNGGRFRILVVVDDYTRELDALIAQRGRPLGYVSEYPSGEGRLYAEDLIVKIEGGAGTMIVPA